MRSPFFQSTPPSGIFYALALSGILAAIGLTGVHDPDIWWHLANGWVITKLHIIPKNDLFSYTAFGAPWVNHEWLFQVAAWLLYEYGDTVAITLFKFLLACGLTAVLFRTIVLLTKNRSVALWGSVLFIYACSTRILERPYLVGLVLLAIFIYVLHRYARDGTRWIWLLPPLEVIWINMHGGGLLGPQVVLAFAAGESMTALFQGRYGVPETIPRERRHRLWLIGFACLAAATLNPWGADTLLFPFRHFEMKAILAHTAEWLPLLHPDLDTLLPPLVTLALALAMWISFALNARQARPSHLLLVGLLTWLLVKSHRFGPDFLVIAMPLFCLNIASVVQQRTRSRITGHAFAWAHIAAVFILSYSAIAFGIPGATTGARIMPINLKAAYVFAPQRMVDFLEREEIRGRVFNEMVIGSYLIFRRWPGERVFVDGRTPVYGDPFYESIYNTFLSSRNFERLDQQYRFDYMVFPGDQFWGRRFFHEYLWKHPRWRLVYAAPDGMVYVRNEPKFAGVIERFALKENPLIELMQREDAKAKKSRGNDRSTDLPTRVGGCNLIAPKAARNP